jgi:2-oxo-4-hydroxy-4-carboxy-5-ureidoimidazoline decarboxylase
MSTPAATRGLHPLLTELDRIQIRLAALNDCAPITARAQFKRCCNSSQWVHCMEQARPFSDMAELEACADRIWASCSPKDWLEAFSAHPKIGDQSENRRSRQEQSEMAVAAPEVLKALAQANRIYEAKFGYTFIVCATGKSAAEMLALLQQRLNNRHDNELLNTAEQQRLILRLRLRKLLST